MNLKNYLAFSNFMRSVDPENQLLQLTDQGGYLCICLTDSVSVGDIISVSPYGSEETHFIKVAGVFRSVLSKQHGDGRCLCQKMPGIPHLISTVYPGR